GTPEQVASVQESFTGSYLKALVKPDAVGARDVVVAQKKPRAKRAPEALTKPSKRPAVKSAKTRMQEKRAAAKVSP
ncbi:MAG: hypothetical protein JWN41_706, partial [Thermoleophilia bacterium]|nr:hypothetical protein [Thermoleophilia bacterium]